MPYSFTAIEKEKTNIINIAALILIGFYFVSLWVLFVLMRMFFVDWLIIESPEGIGPVSVKMNIPVFSLTESLIVLAFSVMISIFQIGATSSNMIDRIITALRAKAPKKLGTDS